MISRRERRRLIRRVKSELRIEDWYYDLNLRIGDFALPVLFSFIVAFGGASAEGLGAHAIMLLACGMIGAAIIFTTPRSAFPISLGALPIFLVSYVAIALMQQLALPAGLLGGGDDRALVAEGRQLLQLGTRFQSISFVPSNTSAAMAYALIPAAVLLLTVKLGWRSVVRFLPWTMAVLGASSALLGLLQVVLPSAPELYLYVYTNRGLPVGVFSNVNHHASFLLMTLAYSSVLLAGVSARKLRTDADIAKLILTVLLCGLQLLGILAAGSVAGYLILIPVLGLCLFIVKSRRHRFKIKQAIPVAIGVLVMIAAVVASPRLTDLGSTSIANDGPMSRLGIAEVGLEVYADHYFLGTGLGTFESVFKLHENQETVSLDFANHAHNDYLQWCIETGLPGLILLGAFLFWLGPRMRRAWHRLDSPAFRMRRAATIATLVPLLHSFVDYPLRSPSILALASLGVVILVLPYVPRDNLVNEAPEEPSN